MCGHEYVWLDLIDRLIDHHHGDRIRFIKRLRANQALIISFISSFMLNFLCLRVFDYFSTLFWQTERTKTLDPRSSEPGAEKEFISNFCLRPHLLIWYHSVHHVPKIVTPLFTLQNFCHLSIMIRFGTFISVYFLKLEPCLKPFVLVLLFDIMCHFWWLPL